MPGARSTGVAVAAYAATTTLSGGRSSRACGQSEIKGMCVFLTDGVATAARGTDEALSADRRLPFGYGASDSMSRP